MGATKDAESESGRSILIEDVRVPPDWGIPGWSRERFEAFNNVRRRLHKTMQGWDKRLIG